MISRNSNQHSLSRPLARPLTEQHLAEALNRNKPTHKFRAECPVDVAHFILLLPEVGKFCKIVAWNPHPLTPDLEVTLATEMTTQQLRQVMAQVEDGHVMRQTLQPIAEYTGERDFSL
jgi:hypothetical protein